MDPIKRPHRIPKRVFQVVESFDTFFKNQSAGGMVLLACVIIALVWANSSYSVSYFNIIDAKAGIHVGGFELQKNIGLWISEGLMTFFFLLAGLEIKREILSGELGSLKKAIFPVTISLLGMLLPALIYVYITWGQDKIIGWAIPMATDIAFALGLLSILRNKIPRALIVLFSAAVIVDDLGAVIIIAIFFNDSIGYNYLLAGAFVYALMILCNRWDIRNLAFYGVLGAILWYCLLRAGLHATIAGVLVAFVIPGRSCYNSVDLHKKLANLMARFKRAITKGGDDTPSDFENESEKAIVQSIETTAYHYETPLHRLEHRLHKFITFFVVPVFVLFNSGMIISMGAFHSAADDPMVWGIVFGLAVGKFIALGLIPYLLIKFNLVYVSATIKAGDFIPLGILSGMGFTMSIFIAELALGGNDGWLMSAKLAILLSSLFCGILGFIALYIRFGFRKPI